VVSAQENLLFSLPNELRRDLKARKGVEATRVRHDAGAPGPESLH
jgi:4-hydroxy-3-methylbut-2-en-1-yl diphosphate reductase